jgi:hypothetical protein
MVTLGALFVACGRRTYSLARFVILFAYDVANVITV